VVRTLSDGVEVKEVDSQGRLVLPRDWRESEVGPTRQLYIVKRKGYLKVIPKRDVDLTEDFDKIDIGVGAIGSWKEFEKTMHEASL
jgi:bifunctional DNA-binding transcriptional regulator/antitoxin component of YhaV-PrlF toxin-antitoxin module